MQTSCTKNSVPSEGTLTPKIFCTVITQFNRQTISNTIISVTKDNCFVNIGCKSSAAFGRIAYTEGCIMSRVITCRRTIGKNSRFNESRVINTTNLASEKLVGSAVIGSLNPCPTIGLTWPQANANANYYEHIKASLLKNNPTSIS